MIILHFYLDEGSLNTHVSGGKGCDGVHVFWFMLVLASLSACGAHSAVC